MAKDLMAEKAAVPQQPVISIRISDELRLRLETLKEIMAAKSGEPVSTSEAAKQLLESAKEERLEFVNLLSEPTDSLVKIRGKADANPEGGRNSITRIVILALLRCVLFLGLAIPQFRKRLFGSNDQGLPSTTEPPGRSLRREASNPP